MAASAPQGAPVEGLVDACDSNHSRSLSFVVAKTGAVPLYINLQGALEENWPEASGGTSEESCWKYAPSLLKDSRTQE